MRGSNIFNPKSYLQIVVNHYFYICKVHQYRVSVTVRVLTMKTRVNLKDALNYALNGWYNLLFLGLILFLAENMYNLPGNPPGFDLYDLSVLLIIVLLWIMESGYIFLILESTVHGSNKSPKFIGFKSIIVHGVKENLVLFTYLLLPMALILVAILDGKILMKVLELNPEVIMYYLRSARMLYFLAVIVIFAVIYFWYMGVLLNMAHYRGTVHSGFDFKGIKQRFKNSGIKNLSFIYFFLAVASLILVLTFLTYSFVPVYIFRWDLVDILTQFLIGPLLIISGVRMLGLLDQKS